MLLRECGCVSVRACTFERACVFVRARVCICECFWVIVSVSDEG